MFTFIFIFMFICRCIFAANVFVSVYLLHLLSVLVDVCLYMYAEISLFFCILFVSVCLCIFLRLNRRLFLFILKYFVCLCMHLVWSEVTLFNESDPGGWIPAAITRTISAKLLPLTVERFSSQILKH